MEAHASSAAVFGGDNRVSSGGVDRAGDVRLVEGGEGEEGEFER